MMELKRDKAGKPVEGWEENVFFYFNGKCFAWMNHKGTFWCKEWNQELKVSTHEEVERIAKLGNFK